jgi:hypothetical protein
MKKTLLFLGIIFLFLFLVFQINLYFIKNYDRINSCGSEFNDIYQEYLDRELPPEFCLNLDNIKIQYRENSKGYSSCNAFNGHKFYELNNRRYNDSIFTSIFFIGYESRSPEPIRVGSCIESYSIQTKKNYCNMIPLVNESNNFPERQRDECVVVLAYYLNNLSLCNETSEPRYLREEDYYENQSYAVKYQKHLNNARYECYSLIAKKNNNSSICELIPRGFNEMTDIILNSCYKRTINQD